MYEQYGWTYKMDMDMDMDMDMVMGDEVCPTSGKLHVDGYYQCPNNRKWTTENNKFVKMLDEGYGDLQQAYGTPGEKLLVKGGKKCQGIFGTA